MRVHYLQHVSFEGLGSIENWVAENQYQLSVTQFYKADWQLPTINDVDFLIVMGGPMGVYDYVEFPFLTEEKAFIKEFIRAGKRVLGVCLGAQLIAAALGKEVYPNGGLKEIGWMPINKVGDSPIFKDFPESVNVLHWHGDTFDLPGGAELIYSTDACRSQAFVIDNRVVGLQFHFEANQESLTAFTQNCKAEIEANLGQETIQSIEEIFAKENTAEVNALMRKLLGALVKG